MFIHMFSLRFEPAATEADKDRALADIQAFEGNIPGLLGLWAGRNISPRGAGYELGCVMKFADRAAFDGYNEHPQHLALLKWILPLVQPIDVDFEV